MFIACNKLGQVVPYAPFWLLEPPHNAARLIFATCEYFAYRATGGFPRVKT